MDEFSRTFPNITWPWNALWSLMVYGTFGFSAIIILAVLMAGSPHLAEFLELFALSVTIVSAYGATMSTLGSPREISIHEWGVSAIVTYPRWVSGEVRKYSVPFNRVRSVTRGLRGWRLSGDLTSGRNARRRYLTLSDANVVRIRRAWSDWKQASSSPVSRTE